MFLYLLVAFCDYLDGNTIFSCGDGCDLCSLDVIVQANIFGSEAQT